MDLAIGELRALDPVRQVFHVLRVEDGDGDRLEVAVAELRDHVFVLVAEEDAQLHAGRFGDAREHGRSAKHVGAPRLADDDDLRRTARLRHQRLQLCGVFGRNLRAVVVLLKALLVAVDRVEEAIVCQPPGEALSGDDAFFLLHHKSAPLRLIQIAGSIASVTSARQTLGQARL